jgi:glycosyltransferase involved in cell wall biosynthesis
MQIVLVTHFYPAHRGGVEIVAGQLAARMAAGGCTVVWCASDTDKPPELDGVRCVPMRTFNGIERLSGMPYPLWSPASLAQLSRLVKASDALHLHDCIYASSLAAAWLARRHRKRFVVTQHIGQRPLPPLLRPLLGAANRLGAWSVLRPAAGVAFISPVVRTYFESLLGPAPTFHHVPNGVDTTLFCPSPDEPASQRAALGFDPLRPLILFVGRFVAVKRLSIVRAMAALRLDWQWCLIGQGPEDPAGWGLPNVRVLGPMPQAGLVSYYRAADLLVLPSESEGFPLVVQEAMACGLPACITANVSAGSNMPSDIWLELPEQPGETGRLGVQALVAWLAQPAAQRLAQRHACARFARQAWDWDVCTRLHAGLLFGSAA